MDPIYETIHVEIFKLVSNTRNIESNRGTSKFSYIKIIFIRNLVINSIDIIILPLSRIFYQLFDIITEPRRGCNITNWTTFTVDIFLAFRSLLKTWDKISINLLKLLTNQEIPSSYYRKDIYNILEARMIWISDSTDYLGFHLFPTDPLSCSSTFEPGLPR